MGQTTIAKLQAKALQYLELQEHLKTLKNEIIGLVGSEHRSHLGDVCIESESVDIIDVQKLKQGYPEAHQNCTVGTGTILKVTKGGCHG